MTETAMSSVGMNCDPQVACERPAIPSLTLRAFVEEAGRAIRQNLPKQAWVDACVLEAKPTRHGLSLELVEANVENTAQSASLRAFVDNRAIHEISEEIGTEVDCDLLKGVHAQLRITPTFHVRYHLQGKVLGIDPALAESLIEKRIHQIRVRLRTENVLHLQSRLPTPADVTQIAVIHPDQSAGWADLQVELQRLEELGLVEVHSLPATFEGPKAISSLERALALATEEARQGKLDLVLLVRGGGATVGLAALNEFGLARAICRMPVPVVTGIGHATNHSILDEVAWRATDTPSKALGLVKAILRQRADKAISAHRAILGALDRMLEQTIRPELAATLAASLHAFQRLGSARHDELKELWFAMQRHLLRFPTDLDHIAMGLRHEARTVLLSAGGLPSKAGGEARQLYQTVLAGSQCRWLSFAGSASALGPPVEIVESLLLRQSNDLGRLLTQIEISGKTPNLLRIRSADKPVAGRQLAGAGRHAWTRLCPPARSEPPNYQICSCDACDQLLPNSSCVTDPWRAVAPDQNQPQKAERPNLMNEHKTKSPVASSRVYAENYAILQQTAERLRNGGPEDIDTLAADFRRAMQAFNICHERLETIRREIDAEVDQNQDRPDPSEPTSF